MGFTYGNSKTLLCINVSNTQSIKLLKDNTQKNVYSGMARQSLRDINPHTFFFSLSPTFLLDYTRVIPGRKKKSKIYLELLFVAGNTHLQRLPRNMKII